MEMLDHEALGILHSLSKSGIYLYFKGKTIQ